MPFYKGLLSRAASETLLFTTTGTLGRQVCFDFRQKLQDDASGLFVFKEIEQIPAVKLSTQEDLVVKMKIQGRFWKPKKPQITKYQIGLALVFSDFSERLKML